MQRHRRERARIDERDSHTIGELEHDAGKLRPLVADVDQRANRPSCEMHDDRVARRQRQQLMLSAPLDRGDPRTTRARDITRRKPTPLRRVQHARRSVTVFPTTAFLRTSRGVLDFR